MSIKGFIAFAMAAAVCGVITFENYVSFGKSGLIASVLILLIFVAASVDWRKVTDRIFY